MPHEVMLKVRRVGDQSKYPDQAILAIKPVGWQWGGQERLQNAFVTISDNLTQEQIDTYVAKTFDANQEVTQWRGFKINYNAGVSLADQAKVQSLTQKSPIIAGGFSTANISVVP